MSNEMTVRFAAGQRIVAQYDAFTIATDQSVDNDGEASAPEPFDLFLASLGTCAGVYVRRFCERRKIPTDDITLQQSWEREDGKLAHIIIQIRVPESFPEKYRDVVARAAELCSVKKTIFDPPQITTEVVVS